MKFDFEIDGHSFSIIPTASKFYGIGNAFLIFGESLYDNSIVGYFLNELDYNLQNARYNFDDSSYYKKLYKKIELWKNAKDMAWQKINKFRYLE